MESKYYRMVIDLLKASAAGCAEIDRVNEVRRSIASAITEAHIMGHDASELEALYMDIKGI